MKIVLQRVSRASVTADGELTGEIGRGLVLLIGVGPDDTRETVQWLADKIERLRIFEDENGKTNLSLRDIGGEILAVSQFTLYASWRKGNRPSFVGAANPQLAEECYDAFVACCREKGIPTACGKFGADMKVDLCNDGPFTLVLEA